MLRCATEGHAIGSVAVGASRFRFLALGIAWSISAATHAGTISVIFDEGVATTTDVPLTGFSTTGEQMQGMSVTVFFEGGPSETATWMATGPQAGGAFGQGWSLSQFGDTIIGPWTLQNNSGMGITCVTVDGIPGTTLFDTTFGGEFGTPGSGAGRTFEPLSGDFDMVDLLVVYRDVVGINGAAPVGDLFRFLEMEFMNDGGLLSGMFISYIADSDNFEAGGDILPLGACCLLDGNCVPDVLQSGCDALGGIYQGDFTVCDPTPCPTGACCLPDGNCLADVLQSDCDAAGGNYQGDFTGCDPTPCPTGACCLPDGNCSLGIQRDCEDAGGVYQGDFSVCDPTPCRTGACCLPDGNCLSDVIQRDCEDAGGVYQGDSSVCDPTPCRTGACCLPDGNCLPDVIQRDCEDTGGVYQGDSSVCDPTPCRTGACCLPDGNCLPDVIQRDCEDAGGVYQGDSSVCEPTPCRTGACCLPDGNCLTDVIQRDCDDAGGTYQGDFTVCDPTPCRTGACCLPDGNCLSDVIQRDCADAGGIYQGDFTVCEPNPCTGGGEGCSPGYWKQAHHFDDWTAPFDPADLFADHFEDAFPSKTLLEVLSQPASSPPGPNLLNSLGRHTVAALLNAASPSVAYDLSVVEVINLFNAVFPGSNSDYSALKDIFADLNEQGCPLNGGPDINDDGVVNALDLIDLLLCFGVLSDPPCDTADVNGDGLVDVSDLIDLLLDFGTIYP